MEITRTGQQSQDSLNGKLTFEQDNNRIVGRDENNKIGLLISTDPFEVKIARDGFDVTTATNDQLIFNSSQNVFKIVGTGPASININFSAHGASTSGTDKAQVLVPHGLGYAPIPFVFMEDNGAYYPLSSGGIWFVNNTANSWTTAYWRINVDPVNLSINFWQTYAANGSGSVSAFTGVSYNFKYYLMQETAN